MTEKRTRRKKRNTVVTCGLSNNTEGPWNQTRLLSSLYHVQTNTVHSWPSEDFPPLKILLTQRLLLFWGRNCFISFNLLTSPEGQTTIMTTPPAILLFSFEENRPTRAGNLPVHQPPHLFTELFRGMQTEGPEIETSKAVQMESK